MNYRRMALEGSTALAGTAALGLAVASEVAAWRLGFHPALAGAFASLGPYPLYEPWSILRWLPWRGSYPAIDQGILAGSLLTMGLMGCWSVGAFSRVAKRTSSAWGSAKDAAKAELLAKHPEGTVLGAWSGKRLLSYNGDEHQLVSGAAGSGKTVGPVISSLLTWKASAIVYDPKRELYAQTAAYRQAIGEAFYFDPTDPTSVCFNPMWEIRAGTPAETGDVQNLVGILVDPGGAKNSLEYWDTDAAKMLTALVLHALHDHPREKQNLRHINEMLLDIRDVLPLMRDHSSSEKCRQIAGYLGGLPDKQLAGVHGSASASLILYDDPIVAEKTSRSDFRISDLVCSEVPVTMYVQVRPTDATRLRPLTRLILTQVAQALMYDTGSTGDGRPKRHRLLYLLEEFPSLGRLDFFSSQMRVMRGYGITALLVVQSFKDIINAYGRDQTIVDNCRIVVCFAASDPDTLRMVSTMVGTVVEQKESISRPRHWGWFKQTKSTSEHRRPLLEPGDVRQLAYDEQIVLVTGSKPMRTKKARWFAHPSLKRLGTNLRAGGVPPGQNPNIGGRP